MKDSFTSLWKYILKYADILLILLFSIAPLFLKYPYRVNIFLSWEGAYRLYLGQIPYKDFGLPMGFGYWIVPAIFFKIFGPYLFTLVKAQVFMNIIAGLSFRGILKKLQVLETIRIAAILTYCLSYIMMNFWPWYNNSVILWQIVAFNFLFGFIMNTRPRWKYFQLAAACFFLFLSFFTKQDGGFLAFVLATVLMLYYAIHEKKWKHFVFFLLFYTAIALLIILPFTQYNFGYWFNYGQPPHSSRLSVLDLLDEILGQSQWIKFYLLLIILILILKKQTWKTFFSNKIEMLFLLLTAGILAEASIFQVTSYTPPDNNIFFHSFSIAYILIGFSKFSAIDLSKFKNFVFVCAGVLLWWSGVYWKYLDRIAVHLFPSSEAEGRVATSGTGENIINRHTYMLNTDTTTYEDESTWTSIPGLKSFSNIYLPPSTVAGIQRIIKMPELQNKNARVLNMTELTPLDYELGYKLETGESYPLWYHLGVAMFNKQADDFCNKIQNKQYDVVMFEYIPSLNNFYPFRVRDSLQVYYQKVDSFFAPRRPTNGNIEVYVKK